MEVVELKPARAMESVLLLKGGLEIAMAKNLVGAAVVLLFADGTQSVGYTKQADSLKLVGGAELLKQDLLNGLRKQME